MYQAGLVLEGGGMKGIYTAGVLDFFLEKGIEFSSVYGVSAGACHMCSYLSKQKGRARDVAIDYLDSKHYCGKESLLLTGDFFNTDMCYHLIPEYLYPYDHEAFRQYPGKAYSVATNIASGRAEYLQLKDMKEDIDMLRASASLPLISRNVKIKGKYYLDGGISDSIPLQKSVMDGHQKNVVVMTKGEGYICKPVDSSLLALMKVRYLKYPKVAELMADRHIRYNETVEYLYRLKQSGQAFIIRPRQLSKVKRIEKDKEKLVVLYREGYKDAQDCYEELLSYLQEDK